MVDDAFTWWSSAVGPAGYMTALQVAKRRMKVACVEVGTFPGGTPARPGATAKDRSSAHTRTRPPLYQEEP